MSKRLFAAALFLVFSLSACSSAHYQVNSRLEKCDKTAGYRIDNIYSNKKTPDDIYVILTFSGGGLRASALSYGVLEKLRDTVYEYKGRKSRLLDEVDVISAVSGGSFTAAYYGLYGDRIFVDYESRFLKKKIQSSLTSLMTDAVNMFRLASPFFSRIDLAAEFYDENLFDKHTFKDLERPGPFIVINATDMSLGAKFAFTQDQFDVLCSNLSEYSIARAVAASSDFPFLFSPLTLRNYSGSCGFKEGAWVEEALQKRDISSPVFAKASRIRSYQDREKRPYVHLMDGGLSDNLGVRELLYIITTTFDAKEILNNVRKLNITKIVFIVVNSQNEIETDFDKWESPPGWWYEMMTVGNAPMDNSTFETITLLKRSVQLWKQGIEAKNECQKILKGACPSAEAPPSDFTDVDFYPVVIGFDSLRDEKERAYFKHLPTNFELPPEDVDKLRAVAGKLLDESPDFQRLLSDLKKDAGQAAPPAPIQKQEGGP